MFLGALTKVGKKKPVKEIHKEKVPGWVIQRHWQSACYTSHIHPHMVLMPQLGGRSIGPVVQAYLQLHSKLEANLSCKRPPLQKSF